jgi:hypothetical protein
MASARSASLIGLCWGKRLKKLLEARIAAERVPKGEQLQHAVACDAISTEGWLCGP